jgi:hypothetical protein
MNKNIGDFSAEAYEALRAAYADQINAPLEEENKGYDLAGQNYKLETVDARGEYLASGKVPMWQYPTGTTDYEKPDPESLVTALQNEDDEDLDALIDEILNEVEDDDESAGLDGEPATTE